MAQIANLKNAVERLFAFAIGVDASGKWGKMTITPTLVPEAYHQAGDPDDTLSFTRLSAARAALGVACIIALAGGKTYTISSTWTVNTQYESVEGGGTILSAPALAAGTPAVALSATGSTTGSGMRFSYFRNVQIEGDPTNNRDYDAKAIYLDCSTASTDSVRLSIENVQTNNFKKGLSFHNRAYFAKFYNCHFKHHKWGVYTEASPTDYAENINFYGCVFGDNDCHIAALNAGIFRFYGTSFDYHGKRITTDDRCFDLALGAKVECYGCHWEWDYGNTSGQTNCPIRLQNTATSLLVYGGHFYYTGGTDPLYPFPIDVNNAGIVVNMVYPKFGNFGRTSTTDDDVLIGYSGDLTHQTGQCPIDMQGVRPLNGVTAADLPSSLCMFFRANEMRDGIGALANELAVCATGAGTAAVAAQAMPFNGVAVRKTGGATTIAKITGAGKVRISIPNKRFFHTYWSFFYEGSQGVGSFTVREVTSTGMTRASTTGALEFASDTRARASAVTKTVTLGVSGWKRISWKDVWSDFNSWNAKGLDDFFVIEIDTTNMTSGTLLLCDMTVNHA